MTFGNTTPESEKTEEFVRLLIAGQPRIYAFILTLVPRAFDADDLMQETSTVMWRKYSEFRPGSDFVSWGISIAHHIILGFRRKKASEPIRFSDRLIELMAEDYQKYSDLTQLKLETLGRCIERLNQEDRKLVRARYEQNNSIKELALRLNKSVDILYRTMGRVHDVLIRCMRQSLAMEGAD